MLVRLSGGNRTPSNCLPLEQSLVVWSREEVGWIDGEAVRVFCPAVADVLDRGETLESLEPLGEVVGVRGGHAAGRGFRSSSA